MKPQVHAKSHHFLGSMYSRTCHPTFVPSKIAQELAARFAAGGNGSSIKPTCITEAGFALSAALNPSDRRPCLNNILSICTIKVLSPMLYSAL